jgi:predicted nucleic acid-binding protein
MVVIMISFAKFNKAYRQNYNKFLACALEAKVDYIVSGDKHLREIKHFSTASRSSMSRRLSRG